MPSVSYNGTSYDCSTAIKGSDFIKLLDDSGCTIVSFEGIVNFSLFSITGGSWVAPAKDDNCFIAIVHEDGSITPSGKRLCDAASTPTYSVVLPALVGAWTAGDELYTMQKAISGITSNDAIMIIGSSDILWVCEHLELVAKAGSIEISVDAIPSIDVTVSIMVVSAGNKTAL